MLNRGPLIGGPKGVEDFEPLDEAGVNDFLLSVDQVLAQVIQAGQPMEMPAATLPPKSLAHMAQTFRAFRARIAELEAQVEALEEPGGKTDNGLPDPRQTTLPTLDLSGLAGRQRLDLGDLTADTE